MFYSCPSFRIVTHFYSLQKLISLNSETYNQRSLLREDEERSNSFMLSFPYKEKKSVKCFQITYIFRKVVSHSSEWRNEVNYRKGLFVLLIVLRPSVLFHQSHIYTHRGCWPVSRALGHISAKYKYPTPNDIACE